MQVRLRFPLAVAITSSSLFAQPLPRTFSLYTDKKAHRAEDIITVLVVENAKAVHDSKTQNDEKQATALDLKAGTGPILNHIPALGVGMSSNQEYNGQGSTSRTGEVTATVSARITSVYDNGNLFVEGRKVVDVNGEKEILHVSGIIRPEDISSDNTVNSSRLADANIEYSGQGDGANASKPGWWARFWHWLL